MKLNQNSFYALYYKWVYQTDFLPKNLCPFFWRLVGAICVLPLEIFAAPIFVTWAVIEVKTDNRNAESLAYCSKLERMFNYSMPKFGQWAISLAVYLSLFMIYCMGAMFFKDTELITTLGSIGYFILFLVLIVLLIKYLDCEYEKKRFMSGYVKKEKKKYIVIEYAKAFYGKYCPKIDWE